MPRGVGDGELDDVLDVARHLPAAREREEGGGEKRASVSGEAISRGTGRDLTGKGLRKASPNGFAVEPGVAVQDTIWNRLRIDSKSTQNDSESTRNRFGNVLDITRIVTQTERARWHSRRGAVT